MSDFFGSIKAASLPSCRRILRLCTPATLSLIHICVAVRLGQGERNAQHLFVAQQAVLLAGAVVHLGGVDAIGNQLAGVAFQQCFGLSLIQI